jgi:hypothetical protein
VPLQALYDLGAKVNLISNTAVKLYRL